MVQSLCMNININDYEIAYKISGPESAEKTAVILQGWGTEMGLYDSVAAAINDSYRVVQLDFPGFGASDEPREPWNVDRFADFVCDFFDALGITKTTLIGHSYGGRVIMKLAARQSRGEIPLEIQKIVLIDSAGVMPERSKKQKLSVRRYKIKKKFLTSKPIHAMFPEVIDYWLSKQGSDDYRAASSVMKACLVMAVNEDLKDIMPLVKPETLLVWGDLDTVTPIGDAKIMEKLMPNAGLAVIPGTGHSSFLQKPDQFRAIVRSFLGLGGAE